MKGFPQTILLALLALAGPAASLCGQGMPPARSTCARRCTTQHRARNSNTANHAKSSTPWAGCSAFRRRSFFGIDVPSIIMCLPRPSKTWPSIWKPMALVSTKVRINQYDPIGEWRRLGANKEVGAGWRYTVGAFDTLIYTRAARPPVRRRPIQPLYGQRLHLFRHSLPRPGTSVVRQTRPCSPAPGNLCRTHLAAGRATWPEKQSKNDVLDYTLAYGTAAQQQEATRVLYAEFGAEVGGQASMFLGSNLPLTLAGAGIGHVAARYKEMTEPEPPPAEAVRELTAFQSDEVGPETTKR